MILYICTAITMFMFYAVCIFNNECLKKSSIQFVCLAKELGIPQDYLVGLETLWSEFRNFVQTL